MTLMVQRKTKPVAVYHWWAHDGEPEPFANLRTPLLLSIATLRAVSAMPIIVLDSSARLNNWAHFPDKLGFTINHIQPVYHKFESSLPGWQYLSRIPDIFNWLKIICPDCPTAMYVDSDVFWFKNPEPFSCDAENFCFDGYNSGFFYANLNSNSNQSFIDIFDAYVKTGIYSQDFRNIMKNYVGYDDWYGVWDEMVLAYMLKKHETLFRILPHTDHGTSRNLTETHAAWFKMLHCNGTMVTNPLAKCSGEKEHCRGLMCLVIKEFYDNIRKVLDQTDIDMIFSQAEQAHYLPKQFSLLNNMKKLRDTKDSQGHFHLQNALG